MSYVKQDESGGGDTYTLRAAQSGADVDIQLDAATGSDSDVKLKAGTHITLTEASDTITIDAASGGSPGGSNTQVQFNDGGSFGGDDAFTYDKTNDRVKIGNATIQEDTTMKLHVVGSDANVCIEDQDDGSSLGPSIRFSRISASPAASDVLGQITFRGKQTGGSGVVSYGSVRQEIVDAASGTKTGRMVFKTINNNAQSDKMQIDSEITSLVDHDFEGLIKVNGAAGTAGQVLTSQGPSADPIWSAAGGGGSSFASTVSVFRKGSNVRTSITGIPPFGFTGFFQNTTFPTSLERVYFVPFIAPETVAITKLSVYVSSAQAGSPNILLGIYTATETGSGTTLQRIPDALQMTASVGTTTSGYNDATVSAASGGSTTITEGTLYYQAYACSASPSASSQMQGISTSARSLIGVSVGNAPQTVIQNIANYSFGDSLALSYPTTYSANGQITGTTALHMMYRVD